VTLARSERRDLVKEIPLAAGGDVRRRGVFRKVQRKAAGQAAVGGIQLDR
jgi:hypothetical protein